MALALIGLTLIALGIASGAALLAVSLGVTAIQAGAMLWILFPAFTLCGFVLLVMGASLPTVRGVSRAAALVLLALALAAAAALVANGMGLLPGAASSSPLWYVLGVAGVVGSIGSASFRAGGAAEQRG